MKTVKEILKLSTDYLDEQEVSFSRRVAEEIVSMVLQMSRMDLYLNFDRKIDQRQWQSCLYYLRRKILGEPVEYLVRKVEFFRCHIEVNAKALIPRQETEILLLKACQRLKKSMPGRVAWDICTGTGCLGIGLKKAFPSLEVTLSDLSEKCIELAEKNAMRNDCQVTCKMGDLLQPFEGQKADIIICNPPYVSFEEYERLEPSVKDFEPKMALTAGADGYEFYERLSSDLPKFLNPGGLVFLEIGSSQKNRLMDLFSLSNWKSVICDQDWAGKDRFFFLEKH